MTIFFYRSFNTVITKARILIYLYYQDVCINMCEISQNTRYEYTDIIYLLNAWPFKQNYIKYYTLHLVPTLNI